MKMKLSILSLALCAAFAHAGDKAATSGVQTQFFDKEVRAQDDFYSHMNGGWMKQTQIPADQSGWGTFNQLRDDMNPRIRGLIETAAAAHAKDGTDAQKIGDFFASFMDEARADKLGLTPLKAELARIAAMKTNADLPTYFGLAAWRGIGAPFRFDIHQDNKDSTKYVADLSQSGLGMPDRDYYLKADDAKLSAARAKYIEHVGKMLALAGDKQAQAHAKAIVDLETELAKVQWTKVENRDPVKTYNKVELAKLSEMAPGFDWKVWSMMAGLDARSSYVIVSQPSYLKGFAELANKTPIDTWKAYFTFHALSSYAGFLSKPFVEENFDFNGRILSGQKEMQPRWKRGVATVDGAMSELLGKLYVEKYFPASSKERMETLVKNLLAAYKQSIDTLDWMSPATKEAAQAKLAKFQYKIGYPDKWKDYSALVVKKHDLVGNVMRSREVEQKRELDKLGKPVDRSEWVTTPQTINAFYNPEMNDITFPAAILQPPFFDPDADDAVNYGAIGGGIGHEISHGFDDQGSQYDGDGNLRNWWTEEDNKNFAAKTSQLVAQYEAYSPLPGYKVNGKLTLGENIADNSGLAIAYKAYKISLGGKPSPTIDGLSGEQRFFMGWGQVWRSKYREERQLTLLKVDPHSPGQFRTNGTLKNQPGFYEAFGVKEGDKMYAAPAERVIIW